MLDLASVCDAERFNFVLLGAGEMLDELRERVLREKLSNVYLLEELRIAFPSILGHLMFS